MVHFTEQILTTLSTHTIARSMSVGVLGTIIDMVLFSALRITFGVPALAVNTISFGAGSLNSFSLHRRWTYADRPHKAIRAQFSQFMVVSLGAFALNSLMVVLLAPYFNTFLSYSGYGDLAAKTCATVAGAILNFTINNFWTFRNEPSKKSLNQSKFGQSMELI